jgi:subtilisin family serine protease
LSPPISAFNSILRELQPNESAGRFAFRADEDQMADPLCLANFPPLMDRTEGQPSVAVALIDGPVVLDHPALDRASIRLLVEGHSSACTRNDSIACRHGTLVAGVLKARRGTGALAICPGCTLFVRPIFAETPLQNGSEMPASSPATLATALLDCIRAGARVVNISAALVQPSPNRDQELEAALDLAARRQVLIVAAAGNQGVVGGTAITRHPWVIPVTACDDEGRLLPHTNLGNSIGRRGLLAPGQRIAGLATGGGIAYFGGTSAAAPIVAGAAALLCAQFPDASGAMVKDALLRGSGARRTSVIPPVLDAGAALQTLAIRYRRAA